MIVQLYNDFTHETIKVGVTKKDFKILQQLEYVGGFRRFGLAVYDDVKTKRNINITVDFLFDIFRWTTNASIKDLQKLFNI